MTITTATRRWAPSVVLPVILGLILVLVPLILAPSIPLLDPDEGLHASIAQEMLERGDWITPRMLGEPFLDKPILFFWAEALSLRLFGMNEVAIRAVGLAFGFLGALTTALLGARLFGKRIGWWAGILYATTILPAALTQAAAHDVALVPWVNLALLGFWELDRATTRRRAIEAALAAGLALGLSILTKGLVGIALVGLSFGGYLLWTRRLRLKICLYGVLALAVAFGIAALWYIAVEIRNPGYLQYYVVERHVLGFATDTQRHSNRPWWYYLPFLIGGGLPWIAYVPVLVVDAWQQRRLSKMVTSKGSGRPKRSKKPAPVPAPASPASGAVLTWWWLLGGVVLLSMAQSKMITYLWPVFPAVALLAAVAWGRFFEERLGSSARQFLEKSFFTSGLLGPLVLPIAMLIAQRRLDLHFSSIVWVIGFATAAVAWTPLVFWRGKRPQAALAAATLSTAVQFAFVMATVVTNLAPTLSARDVADHFNRLDALPPKILLAEQRLGSLVFYLKPAFREQLDPEQIEPLKLPVKAEEWNPSPGTVLVLARRHVRRAERHMILDDVPYIAAGSHRIYDAGQLLLRPSPTAVKPPDGR